MLSSTRKINQYIYNLNHKEGNGCSSQVYAGYHQKTKHPVAIKIIPKIEASREENVKIAQNEVRCLQGLKGMPNLLQLCHCQQTKNNIYIITDLCQNGTLADLLLTKGKLTQNQATSFLRQIINGYKGLTKNRIIHRDLKPSNIFIDKEQRIILGDFGFAIQLNSIEETFQGSAGSPYYMAPEVLFENVYSSKSDIWAIGMIYLQMLTGSTPWKSKKQSELKIQLERFQLIKYMPQKISLYSKIFLERTLMKQVKERMDVQQLLSFSYSSSTQQNQFQNIETLQKKKKIGSHLNKASSISTDASDKSANYQEMNSFNEGDKKVQSNTSDLKRLFKQIPELIREQSSKTYIQSQQTEYKLNKSILESPIKIARNVQVNKQIMFQLQAQINFFRFLFKTYKIINQYVKTSQNSINSLSEHLLYLVFDTIAQAQQLNRLTGFTSLEINRFKKSSLYDEVIKSLNSYKEKYIKQAEKDQSKCKYKDEEYFLNLIKCVIQIFYQNLASCQGNQAEFTRKKVLFLLIQDFIKIKQIYPQYKAKNWKEFALKNGLKYKRQQEGTQIVSPSQWQKLKQKCKQFLEHKVAQN